MIDYRLSSIERPPGAVEPLIEYVLGGNGLHVRARREGLEAQIPIATCDVRGLPPVERRVRLARRVPLEHLAVMLLRAREVCKESAREVLFHLVLAAEGWHLVEPPQEATTTSVRPAADAPSMSEALVEVHSHHSMAAFFSRTDDEDERAGFRIYGVLGTIFTRPTIRLRVGLHGYFCPVAVAEVFT